MKRVKVKYSPLHSSLVNLPLGVYSQLVSAGVRPQSVAVHLTNLKQGDGLRKAFLGWTGLASTLSAARWSQGTTTNEGLELLEIDPQLSIQLGFEEGETLELGLLQNLPVAKSVSAEPISTDDWEILESHAQYVEDNLLSQVRVVVDSQTINVWIMGKNLIRLRTVSINPPRSPCILSTDTELIIAPKTRKQLADSKKVLSAPNPKTEPVRTRVLPNYTQPRNIISKLDGTAAIYASTSIYQAIRATGDIEEVYIQRMLPPIKDISKHVKHLSSGDKGTISKPLALKRLHDTPSQRSKDMVRESSPSIPLKELSELPSGHVIAHELTGIRAWDIIQLSSHPFSVPEKSDLPTSLSLDYPHPFHMATPARRKDLASMDDIIDQCKNVFRNGFLSRSLNFSLVIPKLRVLLCGAKGVGKTSVAISVARILESDTNLHTCPLFVDMSVYIDENLTGIRSLFTILTRLALWNQPSLLILDNLHRFVPAETEHTDSFRSTQISELFKRFLEGLNQHPVAILAVAESTSILHKNISSGHLFSAKITIKPPGKEARIKLLQQALEEIAGAKKVIFDSINYAAISTTTEGYSAADIHDIVNRALYKAVARAASTSVEPEQEVVLTMDDFNAAQSGFTPLSVRDIKLQKSDIAWEDIGGLHETRRILRETLEWPTKYAAIFAKCPLRLRSGLLLYGYPGCGKTLLASAVAKECGLNFISVKGPELLNKYIGASEQSVRELFERASAAKPCVLFFDEFDSIAPRRGHDSTGVTDRVVNQMLTQMDGAEGLDGVYVLAATSRPDLIDPALLRPGRLDKSLLCHMPGKSERLEILSAISRKIRMDHSIDLEKAADMTDGYSGADLQAVIYNSHLESVHDTLSQIEMPSSPSSSSQKASPEFVVLKSGENKQESRAEAAATAARLNAILQASYSKAPKAKKPEPRKPPMIHIQHLEKALASTRPSVPETERQRLARIYKEFASDRTEALPRPPEANPWGIGNRASLM